MGVSTRGEQRCSGLGEVRSGKTVHPIAQAVAQARADFGQVCNKNLLLAFLLLRIFSIYSREKDYVDW